MREVLDPNNRRFGYPFTNCTQCGPRYSIVQDLPYDRAKTTMAGFKLCPRCAAEYEDPRDRRFHAQPNACPECGPRLRLLDRDGRPHPTDDPIRRVVELVREGRIGAIKGLGGFHIVCDASQEAVVEELRRRKARPDKPLAVMASREQVRSLCWLSPEEEELLLSPQAPIVLLRRRGGVSDAVAPGNRYIGVLLPYTPLHHLLFASGMPPMVCTSANLRDEPIVKDAREVVEGLAGVVDFVLDHDRAIVTRCDDSVVFWEGEVVFVRRARGYVPTPIRLEMELPPILGCGAQEKSVFALGREDRVYLSPHLGDLNSLGCLNLFKEVFERYRRWFGIEPVLAACDRHPDYLSTRFAESLGLPVVRVQHHHAHIAGVMATNNLSGPVIGFAFDGTGLGEDGEIWGGEFLLVDYQKFQRLGHLRPLPLVGGEGAIWEPKRILAGYLVATFGPEILKEVPGLEGFFWVKAQIASGVNVVWTSSMGRLFDAVAALLGGPDRVSFDGQAPMWVEAIAELGEEGFYPFGVSGDLVLDPGPTFEAILKDRARKVPPGVCAARFQNMVVQAARVIGERVRRGTGVSQVCLGGGVFQNRILLARMVAGLESAGFRVYCAKGIPPNDGGISLGQVVVGAQGFG